MAKITLSNGDTGLVIRGGINTMMTELYSGLSFRSTKTLTSAAASTPVEILSAATVGAGRKAYVTSILLTVNGATAWTDSTGTVVTIQDTNGTPVLGASFAKANLTGNAVQSHLSASVLSAPILTGVGFTTAKGLTISADSDFDAGSDIIATVCGFIA
jgi:hypothetical protein